MDVEFHSHSDEVRAAMKEAVVRALETCGLKAEGYAKKLAPVIPEGSAIAYTQILRPHALVRKPYQNCTGR